MARNFILRVGANATEQDWQSRANGAGVLRAIRFDSPAELSSFVFPDSKANHWSWDSTVRPSGNGSARIAVLNADGANNGSLAIDIAPDQRVFGPAQTNKQYYVQFRQRMPATFCHATYLGDGTNAPFGNGQKHIICSHHSSSNQNNEVVIEDSFQLGGPTWYYQDGVSSAVTDWASVLGGAAFRVQMGVDNGGPEATLQQCRDRYGLLYRGADKNCGQPILPQGGFWYVAEEWMTFMIRVDFSGGFSAVRVEIWCAHENQPPVRIASRLVTLGPANGGHTRVWPMTYCTSRTTNGGFDTFTYFSEIITSLQAIAFPGGYTVTPA